MAINYFRSESSTTTVEYVLRHGTIIEIWEDSIGVVQLNEVILEDAYFPDRRFFPQPGWRIADFGAHVGLWTLRIAKSAPGLTVHAFEPDSRNGEILQRKLFRNQLTDVVIHGEAIAEHDLSSIFIRIESSWGHHIGEHTHGHGDALSVGTVSLKTVLSQIGRLDLAKLDIEGARSPITSHRHYFYGGGPGRAQEMAQRLTSCHPGLHIAGASTLGKLAIGQMEEPDFIDTINHAQPDILWVGLSREGLQ